MSLVVKKDDLKSALRVPLPAWQGQKKMSVVQDEKHRRAGSENARSAGVMAIIIEESQEVILIERTHHPLDKHKGQLSFPGGKRDLSDNDLLYTALRETHEEIGFELNPDQVIGPLSPLYIPVSNFLVHPYVSFIESKPTLTLEPQEVHDIHFLPMDLILQDKIERSDIKVADGFVLKSVPYYPLNDKKVWGATAMILAELSTVIRHYHNRHSPRL